MRSPIAVDILMVRISEGQSSHVLVFCVNLKLSEINSFILKSPSYVYIVVSRSNCSLFRMTCAYTVETLLSALLGGQ